MVSCSPTMCWGYRPPHLLTMQAHCAPVIYQYTPPTSCLQQHKHASTPEPIPRTPINLHAIKAKVASAAPLHGKCAVHKHSETKQTKWPVQAPPATGGWGRGGCATAGGAVTGSCRRCGGPRAGPAPAPTPTSPAGPGGRWSTPVSVDVDVGVWT